MKKFTDSHEWIEIEGSQGKVGITDHAQKELGEIVFVELPEVGAELSKGEESVVLESTKAAADVYSPLEGKVLQVNEALEDNPGLVNTNAENDGWLFVLGLSGELEESLMTEEEYKNLIEGK